MPPDARFEVKADAASHFAWLRTRLALERTFMAWIRTAVSLIGFGFTITQFFQRLREMEGGVPRPMPVEAPRDLGLALIATGVGALAISAMQYRALLLYLRNPPFGVIAGLDGKPRHTPVFLAALVLALIGVAAFCAVLFRWT